ncbi:helicase, partial [Vibrio vulnificus]|nr:helicase [Vibrio vulnificus]
TGTGKSGLISISPFGVAEKRVLIITPGLITKNSIRQTQEALKDNFWINYDIIFSGKDIPIVSEYLPELSDEHLNQSQIVYTNIQRISSSRSNGLLSRVPQDFFDFIIVDEAHHSAAQSWKDALAYFHNAKVLHVTGTPYRGDNIDLPGEKIHETPLSEVMRDRYVKWLRKDTVNAHELYFTTPDKPGIKLSKEAVLEFKDKEWIEKSIALSKGCSLDVIEHSLKKLEELKSASPNVPHKILAVGCSIAHAEDLLSWYKEKDKKPVIVHSKMDPNELHEALQKIELNQCDVVISVNMLMEGYDHKYLTVLAIFRPYRSLNAFAQVVGRILRTIPENEITHFDIDNNGIVIFHEEIGLNSMWESFQKEVEKARRVREYTYTERDYEEREHTLAGVESDISYVSDSDSYLHDIDFNDLFNRKRQEINASVETKLNQIKLSGVDIPDDILENLRKQLAENETQKAAEEFIDPELISKRPHIARTKLRQTLKERTQDMASNILIDNGIGEKSSELYHNFRNHIVAPRETDANDGMIVRYVNMKLYNMFGPIKDRDNHTLVASINSLENIFREIERMIR